ncbi:MAG: type VI secretion system tip protein VgrG [Gammaproteobacteria bacterium]|nr:type VI secretion system tip protein VgrG [Gammaproteobacteria bacterium]
MSFLDSVKTQLSGSLNRYQLKVQGCAEHLDVERFIGRETLSDCYRYQVKFTSSAQDLQPQQLLRRSATFSFVGTHIPLAQLTQVKTAEKVVHGIVTDFKRLAGSADQAQYQLTIEPFFALLRHQKRSYRFFLNQSIPQVVEQILREHNFKGWEFEFNLKQTYPKREQINQVNESDRAFIERLLAEVGIFYSFALQPDTQTEIIRFGDQQSCYAFDKSLPLNSPSGQSDSGTASIWGLSLRHQVVENSVQVKDYNYRQAQDLLLTARTDMTRGDGEEQNYGDVYHYQARHLTQGDKLNPEAETANFWARLDHERFLARQTRLRATSNDPSLSPGQVLTINDSRVPSSLPSVFKAPILITQLRFSASRSEALNIAVSATPYSETLCWRPTLKPRPIISGTLTARITSAKANDIYAHQNKDGLYWVKFDADLDDKPQGYESMPVRLAKPYGGDTYGLHLPLIQGTEVAIAFHEGDPDRPYIAHALHDSRHPDHVTERNNTRNVLRTPSNNKLRMEDKRGEEHIKLSTEYGGKTQLNLGHLVNAERNKRGEGFELRTDDWGAIRAGKGLLISADERSEAQSQALAMEEALQQLQQAEHLVESLRAAADAAKAELADLDTQKELLKDTLTELKQAGLVLSAPKGIAQTTPSSLQLSAGKNLIATSGDNTDISSFKAFRLAAGERISLFAQKLGIKIFAAKDNVEIQAQDGEMNLDALKDLRITSSQGKLVISAKQEIFLVSGGAYIRIGNGVVESGAPDKIIQRAAVWQKFSGQSATELVQQWDKADFSVTPKVAWPFDGEPVKNQALELVDDAGGKTRAKTSGAGTGSKQKGINPERLNIYLKDK